MKQQFWMCITTLHAKSLDLLIVFGRNKASTTLLGTQYPPLSPHSQPESVPFWEVHVWTHGVQEVSNRL